MSKLSKSHIHNEKLSLSLSMVEERVDSIGEELIMAHNKEQQNADSLAALENRLLTLAQQHGLPLPITTKGQFTNNSASPCPEEKSNEAIIDNRSLDELSLMDVIVSCVAGGLGVLIDFLIVKIPKSTNIIHNKTRLFHLKILDRFEKASIL